MPDVGDGLQRGAAHRNVVVKLLVADAQDRRALRGVDLTQVDVGGLEVGCAGGQKTFDGGPRARAAHEGARGVGEGSQHVRLVAALTHLRNDAQRLALLRP